MEYLCPKKKFVKLVIKVFLVKRKSKIKYIYAFDLGGGIPPPKLLSFKGCIYIYSCQFFEFFNRHIHDKESGNMMINLQIKTV